MGKRFRALNNFIAREKNQSNLISPFKTGFSPNTKDVRQAKGKWMKNVCSLIRNFNRLAFIISLKHAKTILPSVCHSQSSGLGSHSDSSADKTIGNSEIRQTA